MLQSWSLSKLATQSLNPKPSIHCVTPAIVSTRTVLGCSTFPIGKDEQRNSRCHCGLMVNFSTAAGSTIASPQLKLIGSAHSEKTAPDPLIATRHHTLRLACFGRRNSQSCESLNLSTMKQGELTRFT